MLASLVNKSTRAERTPMPQCWSKKISTEAKKIPPTSKNIPTKAKRTKGATPQKKNWGLPREW
jgi:hypothetical protein